MAGSCASPNSDEISPTDCLAVGTCASPSAAGSENECGTCSDVSAVKKDACASVNGVWTAGQWTKTGVWETPEGGYTGDFYHTDHIHSIAANANYVCYDKDVTDHVGKCTGGENCTSDFAAAGTYEKDSCKTDAPDNCIWTAAPKSPTAKPAHPAAASFSSYSYKSGACRATATTKQNDGDASNDGQDRPPYMYKKNAAFPSFPAGTSPADLAAKCNTMPGCLGFHSGPWMSIFGVGFDTPSAVDTTAGWIGDAGNPDTIDLTATKPNHQYVCYGQTRTAWGADGPVWELEATAAGWGPLSCGSGQTAAQRRTSEALRQRRVMKVAEGEQWWP